MRRGLDLCAGYSSGWRVLDVGGSYGDAAGDVGLFYFYANSTSSNSNSYVGARLLSHP